MWWLHTMWWQRCDDFHRMWQLSYKYNDFHRMLDFYHCTIMIVVKSKCVGPVITEVTKSTNIQNKPSLFTGIQCRWACYWKQVDGLVTRNRSMGLLPETGWWASYRKQVDGLVTGNRSMGLLLETGRWACYRKQVDGLVTGNRLMGLLPETGWWACYWKYTHGLAQDANL